MSKKKDALDKIILAFDGATQQDMSAADCINKIADLVAGFLATSNTAGALFDARIKALENK